MLTFQGLGAGKVLSLRKEYEQEHQYEKEKANKPATSKRAPVFDS
jgi:hypothetical protein